MKMITIIILTLLFNNHGREDLQFQTNNLNTDSYLAQNESLDNAIKEIFFNVQNGINSGEVKLFSEYLAPQVYVIIPGKDGIFYSTNQAYYLLENFFKSHRIENIVFRYYGTTEGSPYAIGRTTLTARQKLERIQVYVALSKINNRWMISQFSVF